MTSNRCQVQAAVWRAMRLSGVPLDTPGAIEVVRAITWIIIQQAMILRRFPLDQNDHHTKEGFCPDAYWPLKFGKFLHRAETIGLDYPKGRQAIAEHAATAVGLMASVWRLHGAPPQINELAATTVKLE
jgi:hypothetical protein